MMMRNQWSEVIRNLAVLMFLSLPLIALLIGLQALIFPPQWMQGGEWALGDRIMGVAGQLIYLALPMLVAGVVHQAILWMMPASLTGGTQRLVTRLSVLAIPVVLVALAADRVLVSNPRSAIPLAIGLVAYAWLVHPIRRPSTAAG
jgi:hypothetical protein